MRLSIEVSCEQHQQLKAVAALSGQSIKDYVLDRVLPDEEFSSPNSQDNSIRVIDDFKRLPKSKDSWKNEDSN